MDMVGGLLATTKGTFHLSRTAESLPHVANAIAQAWFDDVVAASARYAERGGDAREGLAWLPGSREVFLGDVRPLELGSDHEVFQASSFGVPMVYFHDWPDVTIHTNKDLPENLDATKLGRVAYLGAGIAWTLAALPDVEAPRLLALTRAAAETRIVEAGLKGELSGDAAEAAVYRREAVAAAIATLRSVAALWPTTAPAVKEGEKALLAGGARPAARSDARDTRDSRVPVRSDEVRGPLDVYYYDHLAEVLGEPVPAAALSSRAHGDTLANECLNLVDGKRTVAEIRDVLTGRYGTVAVADIAEYLDILSRAKVVSWR
jgi:hypothetical protein